MNENNPPDESGTPFDDSAFDDSAVPASEMPALETSRVNAAGGNPAAEHLPESIKIAGGLLITHGACLALNGVLYGRQAGDNGNILRGLLWFGCTFVLCGALFERKAWAWWIVTLVGGGIGVINFLSSTGAFLSRSLLRGDEAIGVQFIPPVIFVAGVVMLLCVALLLTPSAKAAFGIAKANSGGSF